MAPHAWGPAVEDQFPTCLPPISGSRPRRLSKTSYSSLRPRLSSYNRRKVSDTGKRQLRNVGPAGAFGFLPGGGSWKGVQGGGGTRSIGMDTITGLRDPLREQTAL